MAAIESTTTVSSNGNTNIIVDSATLSRLCDFASKDKNSLALGNVNVKANSDTTTIVATDSYVLAKWEFKSGEVNHSEAIDWNIPACLLKKALRGSDAVRISPSSEKGGFVMVRTYKKRRLLDSTDIWLEQFRYPGYEHLLSYPDEYDLPEVFKITINPEFMAKATSLAKAHGGNFSITATAPTQPLRFEVDFFGEKKTAGGMIAGLLMPMRSAEANDYENRARKARKRAA